MITLLVLACIMHTDDCRVLPVASGFVHEKQCEAYRRMMVLGWAVQRPDLKVERAICTDKPDYVIGRFHT